MTNHPLAIFCESFTRAYRRSLYRWQQVLAQKKATLQNLERKGAIDVQSTPVDSPD